MRPVERDTTCSAGNPEGTPFCKPYPVVMYGHGYGGSRAEVSLHMDAIPPWATPPVAWTTTATA